MNSTILHKINALRKDMEMIAEKYDYNFQHPTVLIISAELDVLINTYMKQAKAANVKKALQA